MQMLQYFTTRSAAARSAQKAGFKNFRTLHHTNQGWRVCEMPGTSPAAEYAKGKDFVAWVESRYIDEGRTPGMQGVLIVSCFKGELPLDIPLDFALEPVTPDLFKGEAGSVKGEGKATTGSERAKSEIESPTKLVWKIADDMPGADRKDVIAACVAAGVHPSTASTQYYRWNKAKQ